VKTDEDVDDGRVAVVNLRKVRGAPRRSQSVGYLSAPRPTIPTSRSKKLGFHKQ